MDYDNQADNEQGKLRLFSHNDQLPGNISRAPWPYVAWVAPLARNIDQRRTNHGMNHIPVFNVADMPRILLLVLAAIVGCGGPTTPPIPNSTNDFVDNKNGVGTARVWNIDFQVLGTSGGVSAETAIDVDFTNPDHSDSTTRFRLGDDLTIQLNTIDKYDIGFLFNDQDYGVLHLQDKVVIDEERNVTVNGIARLPKGAE